MTEKSQVGDIFPFPLAIIAHIEVQLVWGYMSALVNVWGTVNK